MKDKNISFLKAYDAWSTLLTESICIPLARLLALMRVHPNIITGLSFLAGLAGAVTFTFGNWLAGGLLFLLSLIFDNIDGMVARINNLCSPFGAKFDVYTDYVRKPASFLGITIHFLMNSQLLLAMLTVVATFAHVGLHRLNKKVQVSSFDLEFPHFIRKRIRKIVPRLLNLYNCFDEQFVEFVIFPIIAAFAPGRGLWFLYGAVCIGVIGLIKISLSIYYRSRGRYDEVYQPWYQTKGNLDEYEKIRANNSSD